MLLIGTLVRQILEMGRQTTEFFLNLNELFTKK